DTKVIDVTKIATDFSGHGGGDNRMVEELLDMIIEEKEPNNRTTSVEQSVESHYIALAAEKSRLAGGQVILMDTLRKGNRQ
ncbi:MAG: gfo/Idh/MocA family oxidoreductase, partial [Lachnospiraceae bacterium]